MNKSTTSAAAAAAGRGAGSGRKILFVMPGIPFPPRAHGGSIRYLPLLTRFAADHDVDLVMITDGLGDGAAADNDTAESSAQLQRICRRTMVLRRNASVKPSLPVRVLLRLLSALPGRTPHAHVTYDKQASLASILEFIGKERYDAVYWVFTRYGDWMLSLRQSGAIGRVFLDIVDSSYLALSRDPEGIRHPAGKLREVQSWEAKMINSADAAAYISPVDAAAIPAPLLNKPVHIVPNGVYAEGYSPVRQPGVTGPSIGFLGNMSYRPNIVAAQFLYRNIFLALRERIPELSLWIIGRAPADEIKALAHTPGVHVTGAVEDIWPYVNAVDLFVLPLQSGAGQQNKILEVMLAGKAVITSPIGNGGIGGTADRDLVICESTDDWRARTAALLQDSTTRDALGARGRAFVQERFDWDHIYAAVVPLVFGS